MTNTTPSLGRLIFSFGYVLILPALLLILSGDWRWTERWINDRTQQVVSPGIYGLLQNLELFQK
jgi:hypothetical protein